MSEALRDPYRIAEIRQPQPTIAPLPNGLLRLNGSLCTCKPPGSLWCWWYEVQLGDRWQCSHGGSWVRWRNAGEMAAWTAAGILDRDWELPITHPMTDALSIMGWERRVVPGNQHRSRWSRPATPRHGGAGGNDRGT